MKDFGGDLGPALEHIKKIQLYNRPSKSRTFNYAHMICHLRIVKVNELCPEIREVFHGECTCVFIASFRMFISR